MRAANEMAPIPAEPGNQMLGAETATRRALGVGLVPPEQRGNDWCVSRSRGKEGGDRFRVNRSRLGKRDLEASFFFEASHPIAVCDMPYARIFALHNVTKQPALTLVL